MNAYSKLRLNRLFLGTLLVSLVTFAADADSAIGSSNFRNATIFHDGNANGVQDSTESPTVTKADGKFILPQGKGPLVLTGGVDIVTGESNTFTLTAPKSSKGIGILSTIWQALLDRGFRNADLQYLLGLSFDDLGKSIPKAKRPVIRNYTLGESSHTSPQQQILRTADAQWETMVTVLRSVLAGTGVSSAEAAALQGIIIFLAKQNGSDVSQFLVDPDRTAQVLGDIFASLQVQLADGEIPAIGAYVAAVNDRMARYSHTQADVRTQRFAVTEELVLGNFAAISDTSVGHFYLLHDLQDDAALWGGSSAGDNYVNGFSPLSGDGRFAIFKDEREPRRKLDGTIEYAPPFYVFDRSAEKAISLSGRPTSASMSTDGRHVVMQLGADIIRRDLSTLIEDVVASNLKPESLTYTNISGDGQSIYYRTSDHPECISRWDSHTKSTSLIVCPINNSAVSFSKTDLPAVSLDGRFIAFLGVEHVGPNEAFGQVFLHDAQAGSTQLVSRTKNGGFPTRKDNPDGNFALFDAIAISDDGRYVAFESDASNLIASAGTIGRSIYLVDTQSNDMSLLSVDSKGRAPKRGDSRRPSISGDGRYVVFDSDATTLVAGDTNKKTDVFLRDTQLGKTYLLSKSYTGRPASSNLCIATAGGGCSLLPVGHSQNAHISADGRTVSFNSSATNLSPKSDGTDGLEHTYLITNGWW